MLQIYFLNRFAFVARVCFIFSSLIFPSYVLGTEEIENTNIKYVHETEPSKLYVDQEWKLAPLGRSGSEFLSFFFMDSVTGAIRATLKSNITNYDKFIRSVIVYTFLQQVAVTVIVVIGFLVALLLLLMPWFIAWYRNRQDVIVAESESVSSVVSPRFGCIAFEFIVVFLGIAIFGAILLCISVITFYYHIPELFDFAAYSVNITYKTKDIIRNNFFSNLFEVSRSTYEAVQILYDVNDNVGREYMTSINNYISPLLYVSGSIQFAVLQLKSFFTIDSQEFLSFVNSTNIDVKKLREEYGATLDELKREFYKENASQMFGPVLDSVVVPTYNPPDLPTKLYNESIERLNAISKLQLRDKVSNFSRNLHSVVENPNFDPTSLMKKLQQEGIETEEEIGMTVEKFVAFIDATFTEEYRDAAIKFIENLRSSVMKYCRHWHVLVLVFSIFAAILGIFIFLIYSCGTIGTKGFYILPSGENVYKSDLSHRSGKVLVVFLHFSVVFLALFWALSLFLFIFSSIPLELCSSSKDKSLFEVTLDHISFQVPENWFSLYSSKKFNISIRSSLINCLNDSTYFGPLPDPMVNESKFEIIKENLDTYSAEEKFEKLVQNLTKITISESEEKTLNVENILDFNATSYFSYMDSFIHNLSNTEALNIFITIEKHPESSQKLKNKVQIAIKAYETLISKLSTSIVFGEVVNTSYNNANTILQTMKKQISKFKEQTEEFQDFIKTNATVLYITILNETLKSTIDGVHYSLDTGTIQFRSTISFCPVILFLYDKLLYISCELILFPVAAGWFGSLFFDIFFLLTICFCLYTVPLFIKQPEVNSAEIPPTIVRASDIPSPIAIDDNVSQSLLLATDTDVENNSTASEMEKSVVGSQEDLNTPSLVYDSFRQVEEAKPRRQTDPSPRQPSVSSELNDEMSASLTDHNTDTSGGDEPSTDVKKTSVTKDELVSPVIGQEKESEDVEQIESKSNEPSAFRDNDNVSIADPDSVTLKSSDLLKDVTESSATFHAQERTVINLENQSSKDKTEKTEIEEKSS